MIKPFPADPITELFFSLGMTWMSSSEDGDQKVDGEKKVVPVDPRVEAAARGDRRAAAELFRELLPRVRNLVRYLTRGDGDVDDIVQEALVAVFRGLSGYRGEAPLENWCDRVTVRVTFAYLRRRRTDRAREAGREPDLYAVSEDARPDAYVERRRAVAMLDELPDEQREPLVLHHCVGMSVPEIAEMLDVPFETVRSRLRLGAGKLRQKFAGEEGRWTGETGAGEPKADRDSE